MPEYARVCQGMPKYADVCQSMPVYARVCQSMSVYAAETALFRGKKMISQFWHIEIYYYFLGFCKHLIQLLCSLHPLAADWLKGGDFASTRPAIKNARASWMQHMPEYARVC